MSLLELLPFSRLQNEKSLKAKQRLTSLKKAYQKNPHFVFCDTVKKHLPLCITNGDALIHNQSNDVYGLVFINHIVL